MLLVVSSMAKRHKGFRQHQEGSRLVYEMDLQVEGSCPVCLFRVVWFVFRTYFERVPCMFGTCSKYVWNKSLLQVILEGDTSLWAERNKLIKMTGKKEEIRIGLNW